MQPVHHIQDRNDHTRSQVEDSITYMLDTQASRTTFPTFVDVFRLPRPLSPPVVDLTQTPDDGRQPDSAQ